MGCMPSRARDGHAGPEMPSSAISGSNQAQSKRELHMFHDIIAQDHEKTAMADELQKQVYEGIYLAGKTKYWVDEKRYNCFMLFPRGLSIAWGEDASYWSWRNLEDYNDPEVEAAILEEVCWLDIQGKQELTHLTPGVTYEVVFEVKLTEPAQGWNMPVNLHLKLPNGTALQRKENLQEKPREQWLPLKVGEVEAKEELKWPMEISLFEHGGHWKRGLLIKGIRITPKKVSWKCCDNDH
ncbi:hypothetical protein PVAP13_6KG041400 [Panicum virgatum]|uniref:Protein PHLOEM PROTEIN 2-LIKE A1-like n=1 Tax=Panicum virgatum TaxID=38727 RepID=A0A8T0RBV3_PANVG|nr:hypothetical protein PVAP13_6KG041400 [Panicum virgatum]